ncbi:unnamed protein product [Leptidea sinapis]|uniref:Uncharacterized protein n=1 Tax=Leptidea sinapis TaxID=189913 RepID=A0A5E4R8X5_9NEOP|nr:unnamed protein product [Leptidea sinapis]
MDRRCSQSVRTLVFDDSDSDLPKSGPKKEFSASVAPSSLNQSAEDAGKRSNLLRMRRSALGKSAPTLSVHVKEPCGVSRRPSRLPPQPSHHRLSLVVILHFYYSCNYWSILAYTTIYTMCTVGDHLHS